MVNDVKQQILSSVRNSDKPVSGETLSGDLGISRVAVWKHISSLKEKGYDISSSRAGYMLKGEKDFLYPWEFPGHDITYIENTESTMDLARKMKEAHPSNRGLKIIVAGKQTGGRGRLGRKWISREGGLYFTLMTSSSLPPSFTPLESLKTGALIASLLRETYSIPAQVKWPNDVLVDGEKICGVLIEIGGEADRLCFMHVGIGINVANVVPDGVQACSLKNLVSASVARKDILTRFLKAYEEAQSWGPDTVLAFWKQHTSMLGRKVRIDQPFGTVSGTAIDVERDGSLLVEKGNRIHRITAGDVHYE